MGGGRKTVGQPLVAGCRLQYAETCMLSAAHARQVAVSALQHDRVVVGLTQSLWFLFVSQNSFGESSAHAETQGNVRGGTSARWHRYRPDTRAQRASKPQDTTHSVRLK